MLLAVIGLGPILNDGKATLNEQRRRKMETLGERIRSAARKYLTATTWDKPSSPGAIEWKPWVGLMTMPEHERKRRCIDAASGLVDPEDAAAYAAQAYDCWNYLLARFPRTMRPQLIGATVEPPPETYLYRFRRSYQVLDDPLGLLDQLLCGFVNADEQQACLNVLPTFYAESQRAFILEAQAHKAEHPRWDLPRRRFEPLRVFLGLPLRPGQPGYLQAVQSRFAMPEPKETRTTGTLPRDQGESSQSASQRAELR
jgi:hypothetical protein